MLLGINWSIPTKFSIIKSLLENRLANFCELLIDNFLHLPATQVLEYLPDTPLTFHIMTSRFIEQDIQQLKNLAKIIKPWIEVLKPLYVSDHLAKFTAGGVRLPKLAELNYREQFSHIAERVKIWQDLLECNLHLENYPSINTSTMPQAEFFDKLKNITGCELLFDFTNAHIAEINTGYNLSSWDSLLLTTKHYHIAGYSWFDHSSQLAMDTHDKKIGRSLYKILNDRKENITTLVLERDNNIHLDSYNSELQQVKKIFSKNTLRSPLSND